MPKKTPRIAKTYRASIGVSITNAGYKKLKVEGKTDVEIKNACGKLLLDHMQKIVAGERPFEFRFEIIRQEEKK